MPELSETEFDKVLDHAFETTRQLHETLLKAGCIVVRKDEYDALRDSYEKLQSAIRLPARVPISYADLLTENADLRAKLICWQDVANGLAAAAERIDPPRDSRLGRALMMHDSLTRLEAQLAKPRSNE